MQANDLKHYKILKFVQLILLIIIGIISFLLLVLNASLRVSILQNRNLLILSVTIWILLIIGFVFLLFDFSRLEDMISTNHELNKATYLDNLTGIPNRYSCDLIFQSYSTEKSVNNIGCCVLTIKNLLDINKTKSHEEGDSVIRNFCNTLERVGDRYGFVGRNGGNEFLVVIDHCSEPLMLEFIEQLHEELDVYNNIHIDKLEVAYEYALNSVEQVTRFADLVAICSRKLRETNS